MITGSGAVRRVCQSVQSILSLEIRHNKCVSGLPEGETRDFGLAREAKTKPSLFYSSRLPGEIIAAHLLLLLLAGQLPGLDSLLCSFFFSSSTLPVSFT